VISSERKWQIGSAVGVFAFLYLMYVTVFGWTWQGAILTATAFAAAEWFFFGWASKQGEKKDA
jgi:hypothetical protein